MYHPKGGGMSPYLLSIDQGTSSSRAILFSQDGKVHAIAQKELALIYPQSGWVEQNPQDPLTSLDQSSTAYQSHEGEKSSHL